MFVHRLDRETAGVVLFSVHPSGYTYNAMGKYNDAILEFEEAIRLGGVDTRAQCYLGYALAKAGKRADPEALQKQLETTKEYVSPAELAILYLGLGDKQRALSALERCYAAHDLQCGTS